jgi:hypothetical protein
MLQPTPAAITLFREVKVQRAAGAAELCRSGTWGAMQYLCWHVTIHTGLSLQEASRLIAERMLGGLPFGGEEASGYG